MALEELLHEHPRLPRFTGSNPALWISQAERYFLFYAIYDDERFPCVIESFDDEPFWWFNGWHRSSDFITWNDFTTAMIIQFHANSVDPIAIEACSIHQPKAAIDPIQEPALIDSKSDANSIVAPSFTSCPIHSVSIPFVTAARKVFDEMPDSIDNEFDTEVHEILDEEVLEIQPDAMVLVNESVKVMDAPMHILDFKFVLASFIPSQHDYLSLSYLQHPNYSPNNTPHSHCFEIQTMKKWEFCSDLLFISTFDWKPGWDSRSVLLFVKKRLLAFYVIVRDWFIVPNGKLIHTVRRLHRAPLPIEGEWLPKCVDLVAFIFGHPKGLFKYCAKSIQCDLNINTRGCTLYSIRSTLTAATRGVIPFHNTVVHEGGVSVLLLDLFEEMTCGHVIIDYVHFLNTFPVVSIEMQEVGIAKGAWCSWISIVNSEHTIQVPNTRLESNSDHLEQWIPFTTVYMFLILVNSRSNSDMTALSGNPPHGLVDVVLTFLLGDKRLCWKGGTTTLLAYLAAVALYLALRNNKTALVGTESESALVRHELLSMVKTPLNAVAFACAFIGVKFFIDNGDVILLSRTHPAILCEEMDATVLHKLISDIRANLFFDSLQLCILEWLNVEDRKDTSLLGLRRTCIMLLEYFSVLPAYFDVSTISEVLPEYETEIWSGKVARHIIKLLFYALQKGLKSTKKRLSTDCITPIAGIGCEIVTVSDKLSYLACHILLSATGQRAHLVGELDDNLLACLCIYNYNFDSNLHKLPQLLKGVRESLGHFSRVMAEELLKAAYYYMAIKWSISRVHTQLLETNYNGSGAITFIIYYIGHFFSGYSNGLIQVWDIKRYTIILIAAIKEHKKGVACFAVLEIGNCLLNGNVAKIIRIWHMFEWKMQCIAIMPTKDSIKHLETCDDLIIVVTQNHKLVVVYSSRDVKVIFKNSEFMVQICQTMDSLMALRSIPTFNNINAHNQAVTLQCGTFGVSPLPTDLRCSTHASSVVYSSGELTDPGSLILPFQVIALHFLAPSDPIGALFHLILLPTELHDVATCQTVSHTIFFDFTFIFLQQLCIPFPHVHNHCIDIAKLVLELPLFEGLYGRQPPNIASYLELQPHRQAPLHRHRSHKPGTRHLGPSHVSSMSHEVNYLSNFIILFTAALHLEDKVNLKGGVML